MTDHDSLDDSGDNEDEPQEGKTLPWKQIRRGPRNEQGARDYNAAVRYEDMLRMLWHLYKSRPISDPNLYPIPPETLEPDYMGPEEDGFPSFEDEHPEHLLGAIGRLIAALGGQLEVRAILPDTTITLLIEPGPEHLDDDADPGRIFK